MAKRVFDITRLMGLRERGINIDAFSNPKKYLEQLPIEKIVAFTKIFPEVIKLYKQKIKKGEKIPPIIVVKHPKFEVHESRKKFIKITFKAFNNVG